MDSITEDQNKRKLSELKVAELRTELESRGKDKSGNKAALSERLSDVLKEEGHDPEEYLFTISESPYKPGPASRKKGTPLKSAQKDNEKDEDESSGLGDGEVKKTDSDATNVVEDAIQLKLDEDLNEYRDVKAETVKKFGYSKNSIQDREMEEELNHEADDQEYEEAAEEETKNAKNNGRSEENGNGSSPNPGDAPVISPLTADDMINIAAARRPRSDDVSLIVHIDDTQSELDAELELSVPVTKSTAIAGKEETKPDLNKSKKMDPPAADSKKDDKKGKESKSSKDTKSSTKKRSSSDKTTEKRSSEPQPKDSISKSGGNAPSDRSVWVSGLSQSTRASDLQALFKKYGKVVGAKIITNTKIPGSRYYGLITMESREQAEQCIKHLHRTELNGRTIAVERTRKPDEKGKSDKRESTRDKREPRKGDRDIKRGDRRRSRSRSPIGRRPVRPVGRPFAQRPFRPAPPNPAILRQIELERVIRRREREREMMQADRRRMEAVRQREMERKQMEERDRLEREKEKLRIEREKLDREKAELLKLEREKARLEREKIEREKEELRRRIQRTEEFNRRPMPAAVGVKRPFEESLWSELTDRSTLAPRLSAYDSLPSVARAYQDFEARGLASFESRGGDNVRNSRATGNPDYQSSRRESGRPDRDDRRGSAASGGNFGNRSGDRSRDQDRRVPGRDDAFARRGDRFNDKNSTPDSRSSRLPPALNPPMMSVAGSALGGMFVSSGGNSLSAMVQNMPSMASAAERSYIHSIRRQF